jgi:hypothetical protein
MARSVEELNAIRDYVISNIDSPASIAAAAQQFGVTDDELAQATGFPVEKVHQYFRDAGIPLGTMLTGYVERTIGTDRGIRQLDKGEDVVTEQVVGVQGDKYVVQAYDAYGQPMGTRLASPNPTEAQGWLQAAGIVGAALGAGDVLSSLGSSATSSGGLAALGEGAGAASAVPGAEAGLGSLASNLTVGEAANIITNPTSLITKPVTEAVTNQIVSQLGLTGAEVTVAKTLVASAVNAGTAELLGGDGAKAAIATIGGTAFNAIAGPVIQNVAGSIVDSLDETLGLDLNPQTANRVLNGVQSSITSGVTTALAGGDAQDVLRNSAVSFVGGALSNVKVPGTKLSDTELEDLIPGYFDDDGLIQDIIAGNDSLLSSLGNDSVVVKGTSLTGDTDIVNPPILSTTTTTTKTCPEGQVRNATTGLCETPKVEVTTTKTCPAGQVRNPTTGLCETPVIDTPVVTDDTTKTCPEGQVRNATTGLCETPKVEVTTTKTCPEGQVRNATTGLCETPVIDTPVTCPAGQVRNPTTGLCETPKSTACPEGQTRDPDTGLCRPSVTVTSTCPEGQVRNATTGLCETPVIDTPVTCPEGQVRNATTGLCETPKSTSCPEGQVRNPTTGLCEPKPETCPTGYSLNPKTGKCEVNVGLLALPSIFKNIGGEGKGDAGYNPNLKQPWTASRTYTAPPKDYDYFEDPYFQRFGPITYTPPAGYEGAGFVAGASTAVPGVTNTVKTAQPAIEPKSIPSSVADIAQSVSENVVPMTAEEYAQAGLRSEQLRKDRFLNNVEALKVAFPNDWWNRDIANYYGGKDTNWLNETMKGINAEAAAAKYAYENPPPLADEDWFAKTGNPYIYRDPKSGYGVSMEDGELGYYDPQGNRLRRSIVSAEDLYKNANEFGINLGGIGSLGQKLDAAGINYKPGQLYPGTGSGHGVNFADIAANKLGAAYDWTQDPFAAQKGPGATDSLAASQALAQKLGLDLATSENLATLSPQMAGDVTRQFVVRTPSMSGTPTYSWYDTQQEADQAAQQYGGTVYNLGGKTINAPGGASGGLIDDIVAGYNQGGLAGLAMTRGGRTLSPRYLGGHSDGMADKVPASIDGRRPAALSDGEFVIPADVVSHLGNGNSNAGAKVLYQMMDRIRVARTGNKKQGKQINPAKFIPR